eukprot:jgi/Psemu1/306299/fgenesh1_kg.247_\
MNRKESRERVSERARRTNHRSVGEWIDDNENENENGTNSFQQKRKRTRKRTQTD